MVTITIDPILARIGPFALSWYGLIVGLALMVGFWLTERESVRKGLPTGRITTLLGWTVIGGVIGARLLYVLDHWPQFAAHPLHILAIQTGGISIMGALLGGALAGGLAARAHGLPVCRVFDAAAPGLVLGQAIGRFGCLITGDTVGRPTDGSWGVVYRNPGAHAPQLGVAYQPAFFYEQLWDLLIFGVLWRFRTRITTDGQLFALYLGLYALGKFVITFVRLDPVYVWGLQQSHFVALGLMLIALMWAAWGWIAKRNATVARLGA